MSFATVSALINPHVHIHLIASAVVLHLLLLVVPLLSFHLVLSHDVALCWTTTNFADPHLVLRIISTMTFLHSKPLPGAGTAGAVGDTPASTVDACGTVGGARPIGDRATLAMCCYL